ncbi:MAG: ATP-dependent DNA helicase RecQ [Bacteroidales bacterium]
MDKFEEILQQHWGYTSFRPLQKEIVTAVYQGQDTLALMPTGGGKSITFQVPALAMEGVCIVITPLIALMKDQVAQLRKREIKALSIDSGMSAREIDIALDNCIFGGVKFLYISPERIGTELFQVRAQKMKVNLIAIDEAHCISQWGYDFRPAYLKIASLRDFLPDVPFLALTATATPEVVEDIQQQLKFKKPHVLRKSFYRDNLKYLVRSLEDKQNYLIETLKRAKGSGIIYVRNRKKTREIANLLRKYGIAASFYHAGLSHALRDERQALWLSGKIRVIVSTNAFGMGIDKPNVRFVIHLDLPDSPEAYFQEAGRAGRDEKMAVAVLLYSPSDKRKMEDRIKSSFPPIEFIKQVYNALGSFLRIPYQGGKLSTYDFNIRKFSSQYNFPILHVYSALKFLAYEGYLVYHADADMQAKVYFAIPRDELYKYQVKNAHYDAFIKLLLRSYSGMFSEFTPIDEEVLAKRANTSVEVIYEYLNRLKNHNIIYYVPKRDTPIITFLEERLEPRSVSVSQMHYQTRKERYLKRSDAMLGYVQPEIVCRSQYLLNYFGEKAATPCGHCDRCEERKKQPLTKETFRQISEQIQKYLEDESHSRETLIALFRQQKEEATEVVRWLMDNGKIKEASDTLFLRWQDHP